MRTALVIVVAVLLLAAPIATEAQQPGKIATIGILSPAAGRNPIDDAFEQSLQGLGWVKGQNVRIELRHSAGRHDAPAQHAAELVRLGVDVLVAWSPPEALAAKRATSQIPIVFLALSDPVRYGVVPNLARPGGNVTGVAFLASVETFAKRLQLLKEAVPSLTRAALLTLGADVRPMVESLRTTMTAPAKALGVELYDVQVEAPAQLDAALREAKNQGAQALYVWPSGLAFSFGKRLSELALVHRLPSIHAFRESAMAGGLLSYAPSLTDIARRGAVYVDKILRGTRPGDLPVEQPTNFELIINLKTAKTLGLEISPLLLLRADQVIE